MTKPIELEEGTRLRFGDIVWRVTGRSIEQRVEMTHDDAGVPISLRVEDEWLAVKAVRDEVKA